jgi:hypothetical protein
VRNDDLLEDFAGFLRLLGRRVMAVRPAAEEGGESERGDFSWAASLSAAAHAEIS